MKKRQTSYAFLMEMLWVCGFFALASCIFVLAFVKADHLSKSAENLNHAVQIAQNAVETCFSEYESTDGSGELLYDRSWTPAGSAESIDSAEKAAYILSVDSRKEDGLRVVTATVRSSNGEIIYQLEGSRFPAASEGRQP